MGGVWATWGGGDELKSNQITNLNFHLFLPKFLSQRPTRELEIVAIVVVIITFAVVHVVTVSSCVILIVIVDVIVIVLLFASHSWSKAS